MCAIFNNPSGPPIKLLQFGIRKISFLKVTLTLIEERTPKNYNCKLLSEIAFQKLIGIM